MAFFNWYLVKKCEMSESTVIGGLPSPTAFGKSAVEDYLFLDPHSTLLQGLVFHIV